MATIRLTQTIMTAVVIMARKRQRRLITDASYRAIGGISGARATHADDVVASMNQAQQRLAQTVLRRLVTPERTRAIVELADLEQAARDRAELGRVIELLVTARLLVVQTRGDGGGGTVEIVHESLIERWPTLRRWLDEDQEDAAFVAQLAAAAKQWEAKGFPAGLLWRGDAMEEARRWFAAKPRELAPRDLAFLDAVFALARRGKRAKRTATIVAFVVLGAIAAGASVAFVWIRGAEQDATANEAKATKALSDEKAAETQRQAAEDQKKAAVTQQKITEKEKGVVEAQKAVVEAQKNTAEAKVKQSAEELKKENDELQAALAQATVATKKAQDATTAAQQASAALKIEIDKKAAEIVRLNNEKLTRTLK